MDGDELSSNLLRERMNRIYTYLIKIGARRSDAEDIVQETFYKFCLYVDSLEPHVVNSWLFRVAVNHYYDLCRKQKRRVEITLEPDAIRSLELPEDLLLTNETREEVGRTLNSLSNTARQMLLMRYELELSYREIANLLGLKETTVKSALYRARNEFEAKYRRDHHEERTR